MISLHRLQWYGGSPDSVQYRREDAAQWQETKTDRKISMEVAREARRLSSELPPPRPAFLPPLAPDELHSLGSRASGEFKPMHGADLRLPSAVSLLGVLKDRTVGRHSLEAMRRRQSMRRSTYSVSGVNDSAMSCAFGDRLPR